MTFDGRQLCMFELKFGRNQSSAPNVGLCLDLDNRSNPSLAKGIIARLQDLKNINNANQELL